MYGHPACMVNFWWTDLLTFQVGSAVIKISLLKIIISDLDQTNDQQLVKDLLPKDE